MYAILRGQIFHCNLNFFERGFSTASTGIYEPSAIQQLPDGRFLVVEDEKQYPFSLVTIHADGSVSSTPLSPGLPREHEAFWKLHDLEGLAVDPSGNFYAITSHSRNSEGDEKKSRNKLVRFRIAGDHVVDLQVVMDLKPALQAAHPLLAAASEILDVKSEGGLNIEALEFCTDTQHLLIGFRSPLFDHQAIIASLENPAAVIEDDEPPRISSKLITLNLDGLGIRGMAFTLPRQAPCHRRSRRVRTGSIPPLVLERPSRRAAASRDGCRPARLRARRRGKHRHP